jgi:hypothetical protein
MEHWPVLCPVVPHSKVAGHGVDERGLIPCGGRVIFSWPPSPNRPWNLSPYPVAPEVKKPKHAADHSPQSSSEK